MRRLAAFAVLLPLALRPDVAIAQNGLAPLSPFAARKAVTMLREQLPCLGCHQLRGEGGRIGPDLTTVRERRSPEYIAAMITDPQRTAPGSAMPRTPMSEATRATITRYLANLPGTAPPDGASSPAPSNVTSMGSSSSSQAQGSSDSADAPALYARWCASCHGVEGKGNGPNARFLRVMPANHADAALESRRPDDSLYDTIAAGGSVMNRSPWMPAFGESLSATEIRALVAHIRTLCRCQGPKWSRDGAKAP
jgi:mono/diheme cytochrome c family protein